MGHNPLLVLEQRHVRIEPFERKYGLKILVTGSAGFIGGYTVQELLGRGHQVIGLDNYSKYGPIAKSYEKHPNFTEIQGDASDPALVREVLADCDHFIAGAAMIGGISYFHTYAYDLLATNERITAAAFDAAIDAHQNGSLQKITVLSSSMVFESTNRWPSREGDELQIPVPISSYGFQKLSVEFFARAAHMQYELPFTILRPFNCVGIGEARALGAKDILSGNVKLAMSHVVPDIVVKVLAGQDPVHLLGDGTQVRHYTYGGDLARGIADSLENPSAVNEDFNLATPVGHTVTELAEIIWAKLRGSGSKPRFVFDEPFQYDVQKRVPDVSKARNLLGFQASTELEDMLDEVIPWIENALRDGRL